MVKLADAPDSKSGGVHSPCGFDSHLRHQIIREIAHQRDRLASLDELALTVALTLDCETASHLSLRVTLSADDD